MTKTESYEFVVCPYCGYEHGDAWEWAGPETEGARMECQNCDREFVCWAEYDVTYCARDTEGREMLKAVLQGKQK